MIDFPELERFLAALAAAGISPALVPLGPDKHPLVRWRDWPSGVIGNLHGPDVRGAGLLTGERSGGIVVLDVDRKPGVDGFATLERLEALHGPLPAATLSVRSPSGGLHLYLRGADRYKTQGGQLGPGLDVRGEGGLVVVPGSVHKSGGIYRMEAP